MSAQPWELLEYKANLTPKQMDQRTRDWCRMAYEEGLSWMKNSPETQAVDKYIAYLMGHQWTGKRPSWKSSPVNNRLMRTLEETVAVLTDIRPSYEVHSNDDSYYEQAQLLTKITKAWWVYQDVDFALAMAVIHAYLSTGYLRIVWDKRLRNGLGDIRVLPLGINEVIPIGPSHHLQDWEGVIYQSVRTMSWFRRAHPTRAHMVTPSAAVSRYPLERNSPQGITPAQFELLSAGMQRVLAGPQRYQSSVVAQAWYREFWMRDYSINDSKNTIKMGDGNWKYEVKPGEPLYPRGRLIITGGEDFTRVYDGPNFWWHGRWPFIPIRLKPVPWMFHGYSEMRTKMPMQDVINHVLAGILDLVKKQLNPPFLFPSNAFSDGVKRAMHPNMPDAKLEYNANSPHKPEWARGPELPSQVFNVLQYMQNEMDDDSGLLDLPGLSRKKITPAGDTLEQLKEGQQVIMRLRGRYMEVSVRELGEQMVSNFFQFYSLKRRMALFGRSGVTFQDVFDANTRTMIPEGHHPFEYSRGFTFEIANGTLLNLNKTEQTMLTMALRQRGDYSRKSLFESLDMSAIYEKVKEELDEEMQEQLQLAAGGMQPGGVPIPHRGKSSDNPFNMMPV